ncbi:hypothetical protein ES703_41377 [subsurface metagenome]|jgi:hypothetical protein
MVEPQEQETKEREKTSHLVYLNTQILTNQKELLDRYSAFLNQSRGWIVRQALNDFFNAYRAMGIKPPEEK